MKKLISATLAASLALSLAACGSSASTDSVAASSEAASTESTAASSEAAESTAETSELAGTTLKVAASPTPHAEILNVAKDILAEQGIDLEVIEFTEYVQPNLVTESGEVDANYFQHKPYLDGFNVEQGTHLVSVGAVHYEPFGIYPGKSSDLENIADGATIAIPSDTTNEARALQLLAAQGLITVRDGAGLTATINDITENPHNIKFEEIEAAQLPRTVQDVDFAVINGNYALAAGFSVKNDALATEDASSEAAQTYANVLVVKEGRENDPAIQALYAALTSDKVKDYINSTYDGAVVPIF
ncbi:MetQ/NlpA family ABC transporter substrate-binding protein [Gemmiger formicilis]|jgi:D-methionine transport system substrate-binding protein|uniref:MetQ/NlpA family ABC transporter substrate-binding protein n=1 Tax=Gemmiger formicilis TaxID=745368 RepID=UPI003522E2DB